MISDTTRGIIAAEAIGPSTVRVAWSDRIIVDLDLTTVIEGRAFAALHDPDEFAQVEIGDWGHSLVWSSGAEIGADRLWLETLSATGRDDVRAFLEWRLRHGLSLSKAAEALGVSRRMIAYYSNGEKKLPKPILLACRGWEVDARLDKAA